LGTRNEGRGATQRVQLRPTRGLDKSRHWNVFGGISLYKSPEESLVTALRREIKDLKDGNNSVEAMTEFIRDTIANINGIYHVVSIDPALMHFRNLDSNKDRHINRLN